MMAISALSPRLRRVSDDPGVPTGAVRVAPGAASNNAVTRSLSKMYASAWRFLWSPPSFPSWIMCSTGLRIALARAMVVAMRP